MGFTAYSQAGSLPITLGKNVRCQPWRSFEAVEFATLEWVDWFNRRRLLEPLGFIPPAEAEENYYDATAAMDKIPKAA